MTTDDWHFRQLLLDRLQSLQPYGRGIFVVNAEGRLVQDTWYLAPMDLSLADRDYFQAHLADPALKSAIWPPMRSRADGGWFLAVTRAIAEDGQFQGIVVSSIEPHYFQALFSRLGLGNADVITFHYRDGTLIARYPFDDNAIGQSFAGARVFSRELSQAQSGSYVTESGMLSYERLVSYRALQGMPLVVAMSQSTETILATWREVAVAAAAALGALLLLFAGLVAYFLRQHRIREIGRMRSAQSEKLEALGHLTGGVSHDFANLLNVVSASLRVIQAQPADGQRLREAIAVGERALMRGSSLVEQLRQFARRQPLHVQPAGLDLLIESGIELLRQAVGPKVRLQTDLAAGSARCLLDEAELEMALVNLLVNARDAGARRVVMKTSARRDFVCLAVIDDGEGMTLEARRRVFEPYFSTKGERGTGLGLAQVYGFMRQMGGDVSIESRRGGGTTVRLMFPRAPGMQAVDRPVVAN
jgi:signal transduction histidine kinase